MKPARNHYFAGRRLLWQSGIWRAALGADVTVIELNPRIVSGWVILVARRLRRRRTLVWGHAFPRSGSGHATDRLRHLMRRLASGIIVYTDQQAAELRRMMPNASVTAAPNSLYSIAEHPPVTRTESECVNLVYVGRLLEIKKPQLLLEAFSSVVERVPSSMNLVFVGDGPLGESLERAVAEAGIGDRVRLLGELIEYDDLARVFQSALVCVCPGYAGLSITQSFWFGVPTIIARDEPHSPEIEAAVEGFNAVFFRSDSAEDLARAILEVTAAARQWFARSDAIAEDCAARYSLETMVDAMVRAIKDDRVGHADTAQRSES